MRPALVLLLLLFISQMWAVGARSAGDGESRSQTAPTADVGARSAGDDESRSQTTSTGVREDPFDYESSEQISEDLSVSFPVDI